jgi:hypothetical protein
MKFKKIIAGIILAGALIFTGVSTTSASSTMENSNEITPLSVQSDPGSGGGGF